MEWPEVVAWDKAQHAVLRKRLDAFPRRKEIRERIEAEFGLGGIAFAVGIGGWQVHRP